MTCQLEESPAHPPTELGWVTVTWHGITVQLDTRNLSFSCAQRVGQYLTILTYRLSMKQLDRKNQTSLPENFVKFHVVALSPTSWNTTYNGLLGDHHPVSFASSDSPDLGPATGCAFGSSSIARCAPDMLRGPTPTVTSRPGNSN